MSEILIREEDLPHERTLPIFGVPVRLRVGVPELLDAFDDAFGFWRLLEERPDLLSSERVEGRLMLHAGDEGGHAPPPVRYRLVDPMRLIVSTPGSVCFADARRREFTGWITRALMREGAHFRSAVVESLVFATVSWLDRAPVHASAVVRDGTALLLTGPSGAGKSTLTYAAARGGLPILTDEIVFAQRAPARVWGMPRVVNLPADADRLFPELSGAPRRVLHNGKEKIPVDLAALGAAAAFPMADRVGVCLVERGAAGAGVRCERLTPGAVERAMLAAIEPGFDLFAAQLPELVRGLAARGGWRLRVGAHPAEAVPALSAMLDELDRGGAAEGSP